MENKTRLAKLKKELWNLRSSHPETIYGDAEKAYYLRCGMKKILLLAIKKDKILVKKQLIGSILLKEYRQACKDYVKFCNFMARDIEAMKAERSLLLDR